MMKDGATGTQNTVLYNEACTVAQLKLMRSMRGALGQNIVLYCGNGNTRQYCVLRDPTYNASLG